MMTTKPCNCEQALALKDELAELNMHYLSLAALWSCWRTRAHNIATSVKTQVENLEL